MKRRDFIRSVVLSVGGGAAWSFAGPEAVAARWKRPAKRITKLVPALEKISLERRQALATNPDGKTLEELQDEIPEMDAIEVANDIASGARGSEVRVVAWNMERGRHWREGVRLIREHAALREPDVLMLSEMDHGMARTGNEHTAREMADALGMNYAYGAEFLEFTKGNKEERRTAGENEWGFHGNALLSSRRLDHVRMLRFPGIEKWYGNFQSRLGGRMALFADMDVAGKTVTVVSTHLESGGRDAEIRAIQTGLMLDELESYGGGDGVVIGGDLNAPPTEDTIRKLREAGFDLDASNDMDSGTVQMQSKERVVIFPMRIDYLAVRGLDVIRDETSPRTVPAVYPPTEGGAMLGDHALVTARVRVRD